mgnify:CR=1 FL=1
MQQSKYSLNIVKIYEILCKFSLFQSIQPLRYVSTSILGSKIIRSQKK